MIQGNNFYNGANGVKQDINKAIDYYIRSAEQNCLEAQYLLATIYEKGEVVKQDINKAINYYVKSIKTSEQDSYNKLNNENLSETEIDNFSKNFTNKYHYKSLKALKRLGCEKEIKLINSEILTDLALEILYKENNNKEALYWFTKATDQGNKNAEFCLGCMYYNGIGTEKDEKQAKYWFTKSAEKEKKESTYYLNIGNMYKGGYANLEKDIEQAKHWYKKSAELGNEEAIQILKEL